MEVCDVEGMRIRWGMLLSAALLGAAVAWGCGRGASDGPLELVPPDASSVTVIDVERIRGEASDRLTDVFEEVWDADSSEDLQSFFDDLVIMGSTDWGSTPRDIGFLFNDLKFLVRAALDEDGRMLILEGGFDFEDIRDELDAADFDDDRHRGYEIWEHEEGGSSRAVALIEGRGQAVMGDTDVVKSALETLGRGSGSLLDLTDSGLARVLRGAGEGWIVDAYDTCFLPEDSGCRSSATVASKVDEEYLVEALYLFRSERLAESEVDDFEGFLGDFYGHFYDEVRADGEFIVAEATADEDELAGFLALMAATSISDGAATR